VGATRATHCDACFTGDYPLAGSDGAAGKYSLEDGEPTAGPLPLVRV
jgi:amidophosphoribosyltransferase